MSCTRTQQNLSLYLSVCVSLRLCVDVWKCVAYHVSVCLCVCMYMLLCVFVCVSVCVSTYILVCRYMCVCLYISVYICLRCLHLCIRCLYISVSYALGAEAEQLLGVSVFVCFTGVKCQPHLAIIT